MTIQDYNKSVALLIHLIVMNNAGMVARALRQAGYPVKNYIPGPELETALLQLNIADRNKFFRVMKSISWNDGHTATNNPEMIKNVIQLTQMHAGSMVNNTNWWPSLIDYISQSNIS